MQMEQNARGSGATPVLFSVAQIVAPIKAAALIGLFSLAACGGGSSATPAAVVSAPENTGNPIPAQADVLLGAWVLPANASPSTSPANIAELEAEIGRKFALSLHYDPLAQTFPSAMEQADLVNHRIPVISLNCNDTNYNIARGSQDAALSQKAAAIRSFGEPVFLRYMWEFNLPYTSNGRAACSDPVRDTDGYFSPVEYIAAFQHIHDLMVAQGATNIAWIWNPSSGGVSGVPYWPGDAYVDWVGIDDYDRASAGTSIFTAPYARYAPIGNGSHPIIIAETGAVAADQPNYFNALAGALQTQFPKIKALVYFDSVGPLGSYTLTAAGLAAFQEFAANPYVSASPP